MAATKCKIGLSLNISVIVKTIIILPRDHTRSGVGKLLSRKAALTIQELAEGRIDYLRVAEGQCLKSCNSYTKQELALA